MHLALNDGNTSFAGARNLLVVDMFVITTLRAPRST